MPCPVCESTTAIIYPWALICDVCEYKRVSYQEILNHQNELFYKDYDQNNITVSIVHHSPSFGGNKRVWCYKIVYS